MATSKEEILRKRNVKVVMTMQELAPMWIIGEQMRLGDDSVLFNLVYEHPTAGWINERFKFDAFADVLYQMGKKLIPEVELIPIMEQVPFIDGESVKMAKNAPAPRGT